MRFEWDEEKEKINIEKHGVDFKTAVQVFLDENRIELFDDVHSLYEDRYLAIGLAGEKMLVLLVVYTDRKGILRVISARKATNTERKLYYDNIL